MGHKHSTHIHRQLKQQDGGGPHCDLVTASIDANGTGTLTGNSSNNSNMTPYFDTKQGPFRRKLSVRNISIRRSFHISKKNARLQNRVAGTAATTDHIHLSTGGGGGTGPNKKIQDITNTTTVANTSNHNGLNSDKNNVPSSSSTSSTCANTSAASNSQYPHTNNNNNNTASMLPRSTNKTGEKLVMERLRKSFRNSFRRKKDHVPESIKPHQWQSDETSVKAGTCMFPVKYLGCVEVFESRGMQICEDALRRLRNSRRRPIKGTLYVTGDGLRVVDDDTKGLIVDQTIEKVSFCAPDRGHERGFSYICRDGTTRRWMCHGFHASKDSGERLSHAVGCAFAVCLERKQRRDKESVNSIFDTKTATFTRTGSFRQSSITERMQDPQVAKPTEPPPVKPVHNPYAVERPHATASLLQRQGSLRGGPLNHASPFKRQLSLRFGVDSLPLSLTSVATSTTSTVSSANATSNPSRERAHSLDFTSNFDDTSSTKRTVPSSLFSKLTPSVAPIQEVSPSTDQQVSVTQNNSLSSGTTSTSMITAMCQELSQGLTMLSAQNDETAKDPITTPAFSTFDKWISTNNSAKSNAVAKSCSISSQSDLVNKMVPLVPPPVVDQMPQVSAPSPPSSPSFTSTVTFTPTSSFDSVAGSKLFTDLAINMPSASSTIPPNSAEASTENSQNVSTMFETTTNTTIDPFDAGWAELASRHIFDTKTTSTMNPVPAVPYKSTNPFLDLSQFSTTSTTNTSSTDSSTFSGSNMNPIGSIFTSTASNSAQQQQQQQMFKAFEVSM